MLKTGNHTRSTKHILLMWFVLFSLSPCVIKEALFSSVNTDYAKPLNKSRSAAPSNSCQYLSENLQISVEKQSKRKNQTEPVDFLGNQNFAVHPAKVHRNYSKIFSGNSPPRYILYKRLKLDVV